MKKPVLVLATLSLLLAPADKSQWLRDWTGEMFRTLEAGN